jgi:response regulator NasT
MAWAGLWRRDMPDIRILISDDEALIRMDLKEMLTNLGYLVVGETGDGTTAVNLAQQIRPDLVIMDIKMPGTDGITAARILTQQDVCPVLLLTAYADRDLVEKAKEAGVVGYLVKPVREADLAPAIEIALQRFLEFRALRQQVQDLKETLETRKIIERAKGVLMDAYGLKEAEAFRRIQKLSMDTRKSMREIAEAILLAKEVQR